MLGVHTILHPTDFSEQSQSAFVLASTLARTSRARLVVLHVVHIPAVVYSEAMLLPDPEEEHAFALEQFRRLEADNEGLDLEPRLERGAVAPLILQVAEEIDADLIVMGTHGRTGLTRLLLGSVAEQVMRGALCPVVTVKLPVVEPEAVPGLEPSAAEATLL
jgi:nucleotide-binding universal stress UspA family protein